MIGNIELGPNLPHPLSFGADLVVDQGASFLAGQSDLLSGVILGKAPALIGRATKMRSLLAKTLLPGLPAHAGSLSTYGVTRGSSMKVGWVMEWKICWVAVL